ncbi:hypothetical protein CSUB01_01099 [Colletotrichum sublineola]|uniref:Pinin/SDK/MemA protein domain-containing protein n=1 Tax=Colletotrichum sublineola TaxID=1173701 RepID=A0A066X9A0_COLSU|nr:hypothetical protein CSUB01_01099 [Colletotrichum sublineola]
MFGQKNVRERIQRVLGNGWNKVKATAGMGVKARALEAVEGVRDALAAADDALVLVIAEGALVAYADEGRRAYVGVADGALAVALVAEAADGDAGLFAAHNEIAGNRGGLVGKVLQVAEVGSRKFWHHDSGKKFALGSSSQELVSSTIAWLKHVFILPVGPELYILVGLSKTDLITSPVYRFARQEEWPRAPANTVQAEPTISEVEVAQKRKASIDSDGDEGLSKRPRVEEGGHPGPPAQDPSTTDSRPRNGDAGANTTRRTPLSKDEEKKRGKRLFGGLLSTLSQTNSGSQHKKRREIEQRQHERAQKQRAEDEKRRTERLARITEARWQEQIKFDEKAYYRPWKFTKEQEDEIDAQVQDAKATVAREIEAFKERKEEHERRYGQSRLPTRDDAPTPTNIEDLAKTHSGPPVEAASEAPAVTHDVPSPSHQHDESGDVVEDAEDMVIY